MLLEEWEDALDELPDEQREIFVGHEIEGRSFKEMAALIRANLDQQATYFPFGLQSRASRSASAIWAGVISLVNSLRNAPANSDPWAAARLNHLWAWTRS